MATTARVVIVDDRDGSTEDVELVWIGLGAELYEVGLNSVHRQQLLAVLDPFIGCARLVADEGASAPNR